LAERAGVRAYLLAGISVLGAGAIAANPIISPEPPDVRVPMPLGVVSPDALSSRVALTDPESGAVGATASAGVMPAVPAPGQPNADAASAFTGIQLSLLTGSPNLGANNVGVFNTGVANEGVANTGVSNNGNFNIGANNVGDFNIGATNDGDFNIGVGNHGDFNVGVLNRGERNFGLANAGTLNFGIANNGVANLGIANIGTGNVGLFNTGDYTIGAFDIGISYATGGVTTLDTPESAARVRKSTPARTTAASTQRVTTEDGNKVEPGSGARGVGDDDTTGGADDTTYLGMRPR
jgi:hypothetical protein